MTLGSAVYASFSELGDSFYPVIAPQEAQPPWVTYRVDQSSDDDELTFNVDGSMNPYWATVYVTIWSLNYSESDAKVETYLQHLLNYKSQEIQQIFYFGRQDLADPELGMFGIQMKLKYFTAEV